MLPLTPCATGVFRLPGATLHLSGTHHFSWECEYVREYEPSTRKAVLTWLFHNFSITNAKAKTKPYMLSDGDSLHLLVKPNGSKLWRFRYRFNGNANMAGLGTFPEVSLLDARKKRDDLRKKLAQGISPAMERTQERIAHANTFGAVADERRGEHQYRTYWTTIPPLKAQPCGLSNGCYAPSR